MKLTSENEKILRLMGFIPDDTRMPDNDDWWILKSEGWTFRLDGIKNFKHLVKRLMNTEYDRGYERGYERGREDYDEN